MTSNHDDAGADRQAVDRSNYLAHLAGRIQAEHEAALLSMKRGLQHAIAAGKLLIEAKAQVKHGQWLPWLREHCPASLPERTASLYMRLARHASELEAKSATVADLTVRRAVELLAARAAAPAEESVTETVGRLVADAPAMLNPIVRLLLVLRDIDHRIELSHTGLKMPDGLSFEAWSRIGDELNAYAVGTGIDLDAYWRR
jgi:Protein of unknown function (DUF3102)